MTRLKLGSNCLRAAKGRWFNPCTIHHYKNGLFARLHTSHIASIQTPVRKTWRNAGARGLVGASAAMNTLWRIRTTLAVMTLVACTGGCAEMDRLHNPKLQPLIYTGPFAVGSDLDANLRVTKGNITGESLRMTVPVSGLFVDIPGGHDPKLDFNVNDELTFSQSFRDELVRHHMFKRVDLIPLEVPSAPDARSSPPVQ